MTTYDRDDEVFGVVVPEMRYRRLLPTGSPGTSEADRTRPCHRKCRPHQMRLAPHPAPTGKICYVSVSVASGGSGADRRQLRESSSTGP